MKKRKVLLGVIALAAVSAGLAVSCSGPMINDVATGKTPEYPDIQPQRFDVDPDRVFEAAIEAASSIGLEITSKDPSAGVITGVATTRLLRFKDDVTITITREGDATVVNIRSASRVGRSDFGMNAKRIRTFQAALFETLQ
jgi:uncharacterized protein (DUF1499 family)